MFANLYPRTLQLVGSLWLSKVTTFNHGHLGKKKNHMTQGFLFDEFAVSLKILLFVNLMCTNLYLNVSFDYCRESLILSPWIVIGLKRILKCELQLY